MKALNLRRMVAVAALLGTCNVVATLAPSIVQAKPAMKTKFVGGAAMYRSNNIVQNASKSKDHTTLVAAVKAAGLVKTLSGPGPFTVFAPTNAAFDKLPEGTVATLLQPANKKTLVKVLTYHVISGKYSAKALLRLISKGGGKARLTTVQGGKLTASKMGNTIMLTDAKGGMSHVTIADVNQSNGVVHVVDTVLMPK